MAFKVAVVGVVGRTNAGKSTLVNQLVGEKVSIVSPVEQTTRNTIRGIVEEERGQLVLLDTPGLHKAVGELGRLLNRMARRSAAGTDVTCVVFDAAEPPQLEDIGWMQRIAKECPEKVVFVLNKADKNPFFEAEYRAAWAEAQAEVKVKGEGEQRSEDSLIQETESNLHCSPSPSSFTFPIPTWVKAIASTEGGAKAVADALFEFADEGERLFDADVVTDYPRKLAIADVVREKYLAKLHQELPHELGILVKRIKEGEGRWDVEVDVLVNRESQKPIAIGRGAEIVKWVRHGAERELKAMFGLKVALKMAVKTQKNWMKDKRLLTEMGYLGELV